MKPATRAIPIVAGDESEVPVVGTIVEESRVGGDSTWTAGTDEVSVGLVKGERMGLGKGEEGGVCSCTGTGTAGGGNAIKGSTGGGGDGTGSGWNVVMLGEDIEGGGCCTKSGGVI